jgi:hypothetical protein
VVWTWIEQIDPRSFRRLQLAAESGGTLGFLMRPAAVQGRPTWSDVQLLVRPTAHPDPYGPESRCCLVTLLRQRGRTGSGALQAASVEVEIDEQQGTLREIIRPRHESRHFHLASRVAPATTRRRSAGA